jgi:anti-anti-sigma regulatory factor
MRQPASFEYDEISEPGFCLLWVRGDLDAAALDDFVVHAGLMLSSEQSKLVVDLTGAVLLSSSLLAAFVELHQKADARRKLVSFFVSDAVARRLRRIGLDQYLRVIPVKKRPGASPLRAT